MSFTNKTPNYDIPLPLGTDQSIFTDWNESAEKIDAALKGAETNATDAINKLNKQTDDITKLQEDVLKNTSDISSNKANIQLNDANISALTVHVNDVQKSTDASISDAKDMITAREVLAAQSPIKIDKGQWFRYNDILYVCTQNIAVNDTIVPNVNCRATNVESEMTGDAPAPGSVAAISVSYDDATTQLGADNVQNAIVKVHDDVASNINDITSLLARVTALEKGGDMIPDYGNSEDIRSILPYTCPSNGVVLGTPMNATGDGDGTLNVNGKETYGLGTDYTSKFSVYFPVKKGDVISSTKTLSTTSAYTLVFAPFPN